MRGVAPPFADSLFGVFGFVFFRSACAPAMSWVAPSPRQSLERRGRTQPPTWHSPAVRQGTSPKPQRPAQMLGWRQCPRWGSVSCQMTSHQLRGTPRRAFPTEPDTTVLAFERSLKEFAERGVERRRVFQWRHVPRVGNDDQPRAGDCLGDSTHLLQGRNYVVFTDDH